MRRPLHALRPASLLRRRRGSVALALGLCALAVPASASPGVESEAAAGPRDEPGTEAEAEDPPAPTLEADPALDRVDESEERAESKADTALDPDDKPPRISGTYLGMTIWPALSWAFSPNLDFDQSAVLPGGGGALRLGQAVFPWLTIGVDASGGFYFNRDTFFTKGGLLVEFGFYPMPRYPFSFRAGFGFGAGLIIDDRAEDFGGVGGPRFMGSVRYEFFPQAERKRPKRSGGWVVGPELGWRGFTPAARNRPMSNTLLLGIWFGYYWGK